MLPYELLIGSGLSRENLKGKSKGGNVPHMSLRSFQSRFYIAAAASFDTVVSNLWRVQ